MPDATVGWGGPSVSGVLGNNDAIANGQQAIGTPNQSSAVSFGYGQPGPNGLTGPAPATVTG